MYERYIDPRCATSDLFGPTNGPRRCSTAASLGTALTLLVPQNDEALENVDDAAKARLPVTRRPSPLTPRACAGMCLHKLNV